MTNGSITLYKNGHAVSTYNDQGPLDENSLIVCNGTCLVKMQGIAMSAVDQTKFAVRERNKSVSLYVEQGKVYFVISDLAHQFAFYTPNGYYLRTEGFIAPAATGNSVKGFIQVTDKATEIGMESGTMIVMSDEGTQAINPGQSIVLAMADVPEDDNPAGGDTDPRGATLWDGLSGWQQVGTVALGIGAVAGVGYLTFQSSSDSSSSTGGTDMGSGDFNPRPASPNR
jgi:hypothetical protein